MYFQVSVMGVFRSMWKGLNHECVKSRLSARHVRNGTNFERETPLKLGNFRALRMQPEHPLAVPSTSNVDMVYGFVPGQCFSLTYRLIFERLSNILSLSSSVPTKLAACWAIFSITDTYCVFSSAAV